MSLKGMALAVLGLCALAIQPAHAERRDLVVGVEELDYFPCYAIKNGEYVGAARDILDAFAKDRDYSLTYRPLPIKRLFAELVSGGIDLKFPDNPYWSTDVKQGRSIAYSKPVIAYIDGAMVRPDTVGKGVDGVHTLGTVSGFTPFAWLDLIRAGKVVVKENPRMDLLLRQVALERMDGAYASVAVGIYHLENVLKTPGALVFDPSLPHSRDSYRVSSLTHPELVAEFDAWMAANQSLVKAIKARYGAERGVE
ncbi:MAG TPA: transporter substrate-binding domain-containing protein [Magnetospirillum sp.]|nr:transporter substrate-binding domain-containing protein [Magnetospirillum sp.]